MAKVTQAEEMVNEMCGQSFSGTIPDGVKAVTKMLAGWFMQKSMVVDGYLEKEKVQPLREILALVPMYLDKNKATINYTGDYSLEWL